MTQGVRIPTVSGLEPSSGFVPAPPADLVGIEPVDLGRPVLNAPYTADAVVDFVQTLDDGNRIEQRVSSRVARDSRGRTRREQRAITLGGAAVGGSVVTIADPEEGVFVTLHLDRKLAYRTRLRNTATTLSADAVGVRPQAVAIATPGESASRTLPGTTIEGLHAEGVETTLTIPAAAVGNTRPIQIVSERWYSPELQAVLLTKRNDPRFGRTRFWLTNIVRREPPPSLFEIPSDFRVQEVVGIPAMTIRQQGR